jgi:hypothetical protein
MGQAIPVRTDYTAGEVRRFAQRHRLELKVSLPHALSQDVNIRCRRGIGMCRLQMCCCHNSLSWL